MTPRVETPYKLALRASAAMMALEASVSHSGLDPVLLELVRMRVSQINRCAFCIHMHATKLRQRGEPEMRLYLLEAWRDSTLYDARERAALAWAETLTLVAQTGAPDADYDALKAVFSDAEQVALTYAIGSINVWNRLQIGFRVPHPVEAARDAA